MQGRKLARRGSARTRAMSREPDAAYGFVRGRLLEEGAVEVRPSGPAITYENAEAVLDRLLEVLDGFLEEGRTSFVFDLGGLDLVDSSGAGVLVAAHNRVLERGGESAFHSPRPEVRRLLRLMRLDRFLRVVPDRDLALRRVVEPL